jgi:GAF domain-containing protein
MRLIQQSGPHVLVRDRALRLFSWQEANHLAHDFDSLRAGWIVPLFARDEFMGMLAFSAAGPARVFDEADFQFFREFAGAVGCYLKNALHVNRLKQALAQLQDEQSQIIQKTKVTAIEQLATGLAHEIHNPLTIISGKAQVLLLQKERPPRPRPAGRRRPKNHCEANQTRGRYY